MFTYNLYIRKDKASYTMPLFLRLFCLFFIILILLGFSSSFKEEGWSDSNYVPLSIAIILTFFTLYRDSWVFDNKKQTVTSYFGLGPIVKKRVFKYSQLDRLELTHFAKGINAPLNYVENLKVSYLVVFAIAMGEDKYKIEVIKEKTSAGKIEKIAKDVRDFTGLDLYIDRERNIEINLKRVF